MTKQEIKKFSDLMSKKYGKEWDDAGMTIEQKLTLLVDLKAKMAIVKQVIADCTKDIIENYPDFRNSVVDYGDRNYMVSKMKGRVTKRVDKDKVLKEVVISTNFPKEILATIKEAYTKVTKSAPTIQVKERKPKEDE